MSPARKSEPAADDASAMVKVKVAANTQVNVDGTVYGGGETVEVPEDEAERLIAAGWVTA